MQTNPPDSPGVEAADPVAFAALLAGRCDARVTRFAPSPTGGLHLGHVLHMEWLWRVAEATGARIVIRSEDHDRTRSTREWESGMIDDMTWLGFVPDQESLASLRSGANSPYRQSDRSERYRAAVDFLAAEGLTYWCDCTRSMLPQRPSDGERVYGGRCRDRGLEPGSGRSLRVRLPERTTIWRDLRLGMVTQHPSVEHGDPVIVDSLGQWTYQLCVVVDDIDHGVDLVVRGEDILPSTGRQLLLAALLGRASVPHFVHHPLLLAADGRKLSKRDRSETVAAMREEGMRPAGIRAAALSAAAGSRTAADRSPR